MPLTQSQRELLTQFQAITAGTEESSLEALEESGWNLEVSL